MSGPKTAHVVKLNKRKEDVNCFSEQKSRETDANPGRYLKENFVPSEFDFGFKRCPNTAFTASSVILANQLQIRFRLQSYTSWDL